MKEFAGEEMVGLIPAAGSGTRLYPFARAVPKEMYPILGKAVIEHCIENLKVGGIDNVYIVVGHQKGALMDYIGDGSFYGIKVAYIYQMERKGLGHAILQGERWIRGPFTVMLGDSFIEPKEEIKELIRLFGEKKPIATLLLFETTDPSSYGIVKLTKMENNHGLIESMVEKPSREEAEKLKNNGKYHAITGAYVFDPRIFGYIKKIKPGASGEMQVTDAIQMAIKNGEKAYGVILKGKYIDIGKWRTALNIEKELLAKNEIEAHIREREDMAKKSNLE